MEFEKSTETCGIKFGLYRVDHDYINSLRKNDSNVIDPNVNDLYCGPVYHADCERGPFGFFVPVDEKEYNNATVFAGLFCDGNYFGFVDYNKMIPVVHERFLTPETKNKKLAAFCEKSEAEMMLCGETIMNAKQENRPCPTLSF